MRRITSGARRLLLAPLCDASSAAPIRRCSTVALPVSTDRAAAPPLTGRGLLKELGSFITPKTRAAATDSGVITHNERVILGWTPTQLYDLVADVAKYHEFLPWCSQSDVLSENRNEAGAVSGMEAKLAAEISAGFFLIGEEFKCRVSPRPCTSCPSLSARLSGKNFVDYLTCDWAFRPTGNGSTEVTFAVQFRFRSSAQQEAKRMMVMNQVIKTMLDSVEQRAVDCHGAPKHARETHPCGEEM